MDGREYDLDPEIGALSLPDLRTPRSFRVECRPSADPAIWDCVTIELPLGMPDNPTMKPWT
jgi:hypothetical protein